MSAENKVPAIRFEGFRGEWAERKIGEIADTTIGEFVIRTKQNPNSQYPVFNGGKSYTGFYDEYNNEGNKIVISARGANAGYVNIQKGRFWAGNSCYSVGIKDQSNFDTDFIYYVIKRSQSQFTDYQQAANIPSVSKNDVEVFQMVCPKYNEQTEIGNYFQQLDTLIAQHQQKHDKLLNLKKALLEKMFPKQGANVPEIRFKGFSGEWEEKQLGDLADIVRGASPRPIEDPKWFDKSSDVGWLRIRDVTEQDGRIYHLEQRISKLGEEKTRVLTESHLLLSIAASVGKPVINYVNTGVHDGFLIFKKPSFDLEYMFQWLKSFEAKWQQYGQPGSQVNLNSDIVKRQEVFMPKPEEQTQIGNLFKQLDTLINQHQAQLKKLNNIKQACLEKMFV
ncbi:MAG: restriction endonuclease subunit S [Agitococcus sp.]|nr:restriction endonuclease subunit S [Agitococcus sp.]